MLRLGLIFVGVVALVLFGGFGFIVVAMRTKSPGMLGVVRRFNRGFTNKLQVRMAGRPGAYAALIRHRGRTSGKAYETPIVPFVTEGGFLVSLPYGTKTDWVQNVLASGSAELVTDGRTCTVDRPEVLAVDEVNDEFPAKEQRTHRRFRVTECLRLQLVED
jgi:hypothetical protein